MTFQVPVGGYEFASYNPFYGIKTVIGRIDFPGQVKNVELKFEENSSVVGTLLDVDGITPVAGFEVELHATGLLPQKQL